MKKKIKIVVSSMLLILGLATLSHSKQVLDDKDCTVIRKVFWEPLYNIEGEAKWNYSKAIAKCEKDNNCILATDSIVISAREKLETATADLNAVKKNTLRCMS